MLCDSEVHGVEFGSIDGELILSIFIDSFVFCQTNSADWRMTENDLKSRMEITDKESLQLEYFRMSNDC